MSNSYIFSFNSELVRIQNAKKLNNPFDLSLPDIAKIAAFEFQSYIQNESPNWQHDFTIDKGKMFGVLVIKLNNGGFGYLGTVSGKLKGSQSCNQFVPSVFNDAADDFFINKGMKELTAISHQIKCSKSSKEKIELTEIRKQKSVDLQQKLFENYRFLNIHGESKNVIEIFQAFSELYPPSAAGECAAPKLLHFALAHNLEPIALAEFWWGLSPKSEERTHKNFYPACENKCRPILEFMLDDRTLFESASINS